jgi:integrase
MQKLTSVDAVIEDARSEMERLSYSKKSISTHVWTWNKFRKYAQDHCADNFTEELVDNFLRDTFDYPQIYADGTPMPKKVRNRVRSIRILHEFHFFGVLPGKLLPPITECPEPYKRVYEQYRKSCDKEGRTERTKVIYARTALQFTLLLEERGVNRYGEITADDVNAFVALQQGYTKHTVKAKFQTLKIFLRYLHEEGYVDNDFNDCVPRVRIYAKGHIPSTLTAEQTEQLITSFDRANPIGKRDYAIVLLALELGLRSSDISNLQFDDIDWTRKRIRIVQKKTKKALELPLPRSVSNAIVEYMRHGRPNSKVPFVFVRHIAPYGQYHELWNVMQRALSISGIKIPDESTKGLHILRHTLGSNLLKKGVPLPTITEILGQRSVITTEIYLHTDTEGLRQCALDAEVLVNG